MHIECDRLSGLPLIGCATFAHQHSASFTTAFPRPCGISIVMTLHFAGTVFEFKPVGALRRVMFLLKDENQRLGADAHSTNSMLRPAVRIRIRTVSMALRSCDPALCGYGYRASLYGRAKVSASVYSSSLSTTSSMLLLLSPSSPVMFFNQQLAPLFTLYSWLSVLLSATARRFGAPGIMLMVLHAPIHSRTE